MRSGRFGKPPGCGGRRRGPRSACTTRSNPPHQKCAGLHLPRKRARNVRRTRVALRERSASSAARRPASYAACCVSSANGVASATSLGRAREARLDPELARSARYSRVEVRDRHRRERQRARLLRRSCARPARWSMKSNSTSSVRAPTGIGRARPARARSAGARPATSGSPWARAQGASCRRSASTGGASRRCPATRRAAARARPRAMGLGVAGRVILRGE